MSVSETTPDRRPDILAPGKEPAETETPGLTDVKGGPGVIDSVTEPDRAGVVMGVLWVRLGLPCWRLPAGIAGWGPGEGGMLALGEGASTTHIR